MNKLITPADLHTEFGSCKSANPKERLATGPPRATTMSTERRGMVEPKSIRATGMSHTLHPSTLSPRTRKVVGYPNARAGQAWPSSCTAMTSISTARLLTISAIKAALP